MRRATLAAGLAAQRRGPGRPPRPPGQPDWCGSEPVI